MNTIRTALTNHSLSALVASSLTALLLTALLLSGCAGTQAKTDTAATDNAATDNAATTATKAAGPAATAKTPCANCDKSDCAGCASKHDSAGFKMMTAEQLNDRLKAAEQVHVYDVNGDDRWAAGHVPGAKHVTRDNLNASTLPKSKDAMVVFYCGSSKCMASHKAAKIAAGLGHTNVWVMGDGIKGWEAKGLSTEK